MLIFFFFWRKNTQENKKGIKKGNIIDSLFIFLVGHFPVMQRDTTGLTAENKELKLRLQAMEQQAELREGVLLFNHIYYCNKSSCRILMQKGYGCFVLCWFLLLTNQQYQAGLTLLIFVFTEWSDALPSMMSFSFFLFSLHPAALNEKLKEEVQRLKIATGQIPNVNGNPFNRGLPQQFTSQQPVLHHFQTQQQQQLHMPQSSGNNGQPHLGFLNFNHRV